MIDKERKEKMKKDRLKRIAFWKKKLKNNSVNSVNSVVAGYPNKYGVHYAVGKYSGSFGKDEAMKIIKMERRLELAMESERFFDLVRWGDAATVLNKYYSTESEKMNFLSGSQFTANKNEYLPVPFEQMAASNGHYTQNCGEW